METFVTSPKSISDLMARPKTLSKLSSYQYKTAEFREIQKLLSTLLDDNIAQNIFVSNFKDAILYLETPNPGIATAFKMVQSQMLSLMRKHISAATITVKIKVSPKSTQTMTRIANSHEQSPETKPSLSQSRTLPKDVADSISAIADNCDDKLKHSLQRLAQLRQKK